MKFTRRAECALLGIIYLIKQGEGKISYVGEVSRALNLPQKLLAQVFYTLAKRGLLESHRGRGGGFSIPLPAREITVKDVVEAAQGEPVIYRCVGEGAVCEGFKKCSIQEVLYRLQAQTMETLNNITLDELANGMIFK